MRLACRAGARDRCERMSATAQVIARLDRATHYSETPVLIREAAAYGVPRMRVARAGYGDLF